MHYLGVPGGQNYNLYNGRYGGHATIYLDGTVYMRVPDDGLIWHVGASAGYSYKHPTARNNNTFGIEMCVYCDGVGNANETNWYFSQATQ